MLESSDIWILAVEELFLRESTYLPNYLSIYLGENLVISGCRGGNIKLWSTESCSLVGEMKGNFGILRDKTMDDNQRCCRLFLKLAYFYCAT